MTLCTEAALVNSGPFHRRAVTLYCRSWGCDNCQPCRRGRVIRDITLGQPTHMWTFTAAPLAGETPVGMAYRLADAFKRWVRAMRRRHPARDGNYFAVFEAHKSGFPHLHVAVRWGFVDYGEARDLWQKFSGSPGFRNDYLKQGDRLASYVAKYLGKDLHRFGTVKRYWSTPGWILEPRARRVRDIRFGQDWHIVEKCLKTLTAEWCWRYRWVWREDDQVVTGPDPPSDWRRLLRDMDRAADASDLATAREGAIDG